MQVTPTTSTRPYNLCTLPFPGNEKEQLGKAMIIEGSQPGDGYKAFFLNPSSKLILYSKTLNEYKKVQIQQPTPLGAMSKDVGTILTYMINHGYEPLELIEYLVEIDKKELIDTGDRNGKTPLRTILDFNAEHGYTKLNQKRALISLLQHGANPNIACYEKLETPLYVAANFRMLTITKMLLLYGAIAHPLPSEGALLHLALAKSELFTETKVVKDLFRAIFDDNSDFQLIPHDVTRKIIIIGIQLLKQKPTN